MSMKHYLYHQKLRELWDHAVANYEAGNREPSSYFNAEQIEWMDSVGLKIQDLYDFAEDKIKYGEPDFETFLMISEARRDYLLTKQDGKLSTHEIVTEELPAKTDTVDGIEWLPRIIEKAKAKLKGELNPDIMYGCGGDRNFLKTCDIHMAEFLRVVWAYMDDDASIVAWVKARRGE